MHLTITVTDEHAAVLAARFGSPQAYVQSRVSDWVGQVVQQHAEAERVALRAALAAAPAAVQQQVRDLLAPYQPLPDATTAP